MVGGLSLAMMVAVLPGVSTVGPAAAEESVTAAADGKSGAKDDNKDDAKDDAQDGVVDESMPLGQLDPIPRPDLTTATSTSEQLGDGSIDVSLASVPINYLDEVGEWQEIDNTLVDAPGSTYAVENAGNAYTVSIPADGSAAPVRVETDEAWVSMKMAGLDEAPEVDGSVATFTDVENADAVTYEATAVGVKEDIVLDTPPSQVGEPLAYTYVITASAGVSAQLTASGWIDFTNPAGEVVMAIPPGNMQDSATPVPAFSDQVAYALSPRTAGGWDLTVTPDMDWLTAPERVYPVTIDPSIEPGRSQACNISTANPTTANCTPSNLRVGHGANGQFRSLIRFDLSSIPAGATINGGSNSHMDIYLRADQSPNQLQGTYALYRANTTWHTGSPTWNSTAGGSPNGRVSGQRVFGADGGNGIRTFWDMGAVAAEWYATPAANRGVVMVHESTEQNSMYFSSGYDSGSYVPRFHVNYELPPPPPQCTWSNAGTIAACPCTAQWAGAPGCPCPQSPGCPPTPIVYDATDPGEAGERPFWTYEERQLTDKISAKVNVGNGNLLITANDAKLAGVAGWDMALTRYYNSATRKNDRLNMGRGWSNSFGGSIRLENAGGGAALNTAAKLQFFGPSNYRVDFDRNSDGSYSRGGAGVNADLKWVPADNRYQLTWFDESQYLFNSNGDLIITRDKNGNRLDFTYVDGRLARVNDTRGRSAVPTYTNNLITSVSFRNASDVEMLRWKYGYSNAVDNIAGQAGWVMTSSELEVVNPTAIGAGTATSNDANLTRKTVYGYDTASSRLVEITDARSAATANSGGVTRIEYYTANDHRAGRVKTLSRGAASSGRSSLGFDYYNDEGDTTNGGSGGTKPVCSGQDAGSRNAKARTFVDGERTDVEDITKYCLDTHRRVLRTSDANGKQRAKSWTANSNIATADMAGLGEGQAQNVMTYNNDNPESSSSPEGAQSTATYGTGQNDETTNPSNGGAHQPASFSGDDSKGQQVSWNYRYDNKRNLIRVRSGVDSSMQRQRVAYNYCWSGAGQIERMDPVQASGPDLGTDLDAGMSTHPKKEVDAQFRCDGDAAQGNDTLFTYNARGELTEVNEPAAGDMTYTYDNLSRIATATDARGVQTKYVYDGLDRVVQTQHTKPATPSQPAQTVTNTYDLAGNLTQLADLNGPNSFYFDVLNRRILEFGGTAEQVTYQYDSASNVVLVIVDAETALGLEATTYTYDKVNRLKTIDDQRPGTTKIEVTDYDPRSDKPARTVYPMPSGGNLIESVRYDNDGKVKCIYTYRLASPAQSYDSTSSESCPSPSTASLISYRGYDYTVDPDGAGAAPAHRTSMVHKLTETGGRETRYTYDRIKRLTEATVGSNSSPARKFTYRYDRHSNLDKTDIASVTPGLSPTTRWAAFNIGDQVCRTVNQTTDPNLDCASSGSGQTDWQADGDGNITGATGGSTDGLAMAYNLPGQTTEVTPPTSSGVTGPIAMTYDGVMQDRRTQNAGTASYYGYSGLVGSQTPAGGGAAAHNELFVRDPSGRLYAMLNYATTEVDTGCYPRSCDDGEQWEQQTAITETRYYLLDKQQTVHATVNATTGMNAQVVRYNYEPYGKQIRSWIDTSPGTASGDSEMNGNFTAPATDYNPWRYASGYYDKPTGFTKFGTRYYMPTIGQFTQADPEAGQISDPMTLNSFGYSGSNPTNNTDRSGRFWKSLIEYGEAAYDAYSTAGDLDALLIDAGDGSLSEATEDVIESGLFSAGVTTTCIGGVTLATGGIGALGSGLCVAAGEISGEWVASQG